MTIDERLLWSLLAQLGEIGRSPRPGGGVERLAFGPADQAGRAWVAERMRTAGMAVRRDPAGNTIGTLPGEEAGAAPIAIGSHTDTVPDGGRFDGALGVLAGLACAEALRRGGRRLRRPLELIDFAAEEGTVTGGLFGSRAMTGTLAPGAVELPAWGGRTIAEHLRDAGVDPAGVAGARRARGSVAAYLELHVEQGDVLEREGTPIGVVDAIVGVRACTVAFDGRAAHAGTTPMAGRRDALVAAAPYLLAVRDTAVREGVVATVGELSVQPGAANVVPGRVELTIDLRAAQRDRLDRAQAALTAQAAEAGAAFALRTAVDPVALSPRLVGVVERACARCELPFRRMHSGAGHDAMCMAGIADAAMIFVPSRGGDSHSPHEHTDPGQCAAGAQVLLESVLLLDAAG